MNLKIIEIPDNKFERIFDYIILTHKMVEGLSELLGNTRDTFEILKAEKCQREALFAL